MGQPGKPPAGLYFFRRKTGGIGGGNGQRTGKQPDFALAAGSPAAANCGEIYACTLQRFKQAGILFSFDNSIISL
jgi:hypothetical protein